MDLLRHQLTHNIVPSHDPRLRAATRPALGGGDDDALASPACPKKRGKKGKSGGAGLQ